MSRLDKIRNMNDDELITFLRKYRNEKQTCKRCAKEGANCNPYTGADCKEGITQYFKEEGNLRSGRSKSCYLSQ